MSNHSKDNKLIAKNTIILYLRMIVMVAISFYTARIILNALGVDNYAINNVVGSLSGMFTMISSSLSTSSSRFIAFELGNGDKKRLNNVFVSSVNVNIILAIIVVIAAEIIGVWFIDNKMVISPDRLQAAQLAFQCSVVSVAVGILLIPYNAAVVAHEKLSLFAYITLLDGIIRLVIAFAIDNYDGDRLILYAILCATPNFFKLIIYYTYSRLHFEECKYRFVWDKSIFKQISSYAVWSYFGSIAKIMKDQGVNILINILSGPAFNAARGIAMQVNDVINRFIHNFTLAFRPQIIKGYAQKEFERLHKLIFIGTRASFYLFMCLSIPVFLECERLLYLWIGMVPEHTLSFTRLVLILSLTDILSNTLNIAQTATDKIRNYQVIIGIVELLNFPISYILMKHGMPPEGTMIVAIVISHLCLAIRLVFVHKLIELSIAEFIKRVYLNVISVTLISAIIPLFIYMYMPDNIIRTITVIGVSVISSLFVIYFIGCNSYERELVKSQIRKIRNKITK